MAEENPQAQIPEAVSATATASQEPRVMLEEFCRGFSKHFPHVEMLSAFHADEKAAGRLLDTKPNYAGRLAAFANRPA